jgi:hypothetical protein
LDVVSVESCRVYYKGEGGGFPQVRAVVSLVCPCCPWFVLAPRVLQLCINHFVWVVCRPMWVSEACQLFLVPSRSSNTPLYLSKCCELGSVLWLFLLPLLFYLGSHLSPLRSWECVNNTQDIHTYARSILFNPNPNPNPINLRNKNLNPNPRNARKELKSFVKPQEDIECCFERWRMVFLQLQLRN